MKTEHTPSPLPQNTPEDTIGSLLFRHRESTIIVESIDTTSVLRISPAVRELPNSPDAAKALEDDLRAAITKLEPSSARIVIDLHGLDFLGNSAVAVLLQFHHGSKVGRCPAIAIAGLEGQPFDKLNQTRINTVIPCFKEVQEAVQSPTWPKAA